MEVATVAAHDTVGERARISDTPADRRSLALRLTTETKAAFKTTELYVYIAAVIGVLIAASQIDHNGVRDYFTADKAWLYVALLTIGYMISRGLAKAGSRDPYWAERGDRGADR
jgi:hypothetical protein